jgi:hypothetical protein
MDVMGLMDIGENQVHRAPEERMEYLVSLDGQALRDQREDRER